MGETTPKLQVAPVLERLVLPRARRTLLAWLEQLEALPDLRWLVPAHYSAPLPFTSERVQQLRAELNARAWAPSEGNWSFLGALDQRLLDLKLVPSDPDIT
jgi:hypothetical protein